MVIYFTDRHSNVIASAATDLPDNSTLLSEKLTDELATGVKVFECTLTATDELRAAAVTGNYVLAYGSLFSIITSRFSTADKTIDIYCEDAGLDLINRVVGQVKKTEKTFKGWIEKTLGTSSASGWDYNYNIKNKTKELEYTSESTALERLLNILDNYDAEMYFSYEIHGFKWVSRTINFVEKRGSSEKEHRLYLGKEIASISEEMSIAELSNVWKVYGADNKKLEDLKGYSSASKTIEHKGHTFKVVGSEVRCTDVTSDWKSKYDKDGRIFRVKYTNYKEAAKAINYAVKHMKVEPEYTYEVSLAVFPDDIECGDYIYVLDASDNVLLRARVLSWTRSETGNNECTLGNFKKLESSMADIDYSNIKIYSLQIESSNGLIGKDSLSTTLTATLFMNSQAITSAEELTEGELRWYEDGAKLDKADSRISNEGFTFTTGTLTTGHTYACKFEEVE